MSITDADVSSSYVACEPPVDTYDTIAGRVVPSRIADLYLLHVWCIARKVTVALDEWVRDLALIADALGWPPTLEARTRLAEMMRDEAADYANPAVQP